MKFKKIIFSFAVCLALNAFFGITTVSAQVVQVGNSWFDCPDGATSLSGCSFIGYVDATDKNN